MSFSLAAVLAVPAELAAHHDFAAEFDQTKPLSLKGVISKLDWVNPHVYVYVDVPDRAGKPIRWTLESGSPLVLGRSGWTRDRYKVGDKVAIGGFVSKVGRNRGSAQLIRPLTYAAPVVATVNEAGGDRSAMQQAQSLLTDSPWAHRTIVPVTIGPAAWAARRGLYTGDNPPASLPASARSVIVRWQSAEPVQRALRVTSRFEDTSVLPSTHRPLQPDPSHYWIAVTGLTAMAQPDPEMSFEKYLFTNAQLSMPGHRPLLPTGVYIEPFGISFDILLQFPRERVPGPTDGDVEFSMRLDDSTAKQTFKLKDMVDGGRPAL
jgi:hypothetical protein